MKAGLTTVVGLLGTETHTHTIMDSVRADILYVDEVLGVGEIAISDDRSMEPSPRELARVVKDAYVGSDAEISIFTKRDFELKHVIAHGHCLMKGGRVQVKEGFVDKPNRRIQLVGEQAA